ncbi:MAG: penicillin-binding protein [Renibacterium salmoninarum]|nr:penicillin-binding protein [Renibacterium salmoninarum]
MLNRKALAIAVSATFLLVGLSACDAGDNGAKDAAQKLADGLSALNVDQVGFTGVPDGLTATGALAELVKPLDPVKPKVSLASAVPAKDNKDQVTATLQYEWAFSGGTWSYSSTAELSRKDNAWTTAWTPGLLIPGFKAGNSLAMQSNAAPRGQILGDGGEVLVQDRPVLRIGIDKTKVDPAAVAASANALASLVQVDVEGYAKEVAAAGPQAFVEAISLRDDPSRTVSDAQIAAIAGAVAIKDSLPLAPTRTFARPVLGTVGEATAELIDKSNGRLKAGDSTGLSGLQAQYDTQLAGTPGIKVVEKDPKAAAGDQPRVLFSTQAKPGSNLQTTLSSKLQNLSESLLSKQTSASAIVAIKPSTGAILAAASGPGSNGYNTAMIGQYAPGSTFKAVTSLAMLRKGMTPDSTVACTPTIAAGGTSFKNAPTYNPAKIGEIPLRTAFAYSCNTAFVSNAATVSQADLASAAASLGVGVASQVGADSFAGSVPADVTEAEHAASMIGQGKVLTSPLAMANVAASIAAGSLVKPVLVPAAPGSTTSAAAPTDAKSGPPLSAAEAASLKDMMAAVVTERNAGGLNAVASGQVFAKTGTAEYGNDNPPKTHAWLIAIQGDLAVAMFLDDGGYASVVLSPLMVDFFNGVAAP